MGIKWPTFIFFALSLFCHRLESLVYRWPILNLFSRHALEIMCGWLWSIVVSLESIKIMRGKKKRDVRQRLLYYLLYCSESKIITSRIIFHACFEFFVEFDRHGGELIIANNNTRVFRCITGSYTEVEKIVNTWDNKLDTRRNNEFAWQLWIIARFVRSRLAHQILFHLHPSAPLNFQRMKKLLYSLCRIVTLFAFFNNFCPSLRSSFY